jgi:electron transfer flavoprotein beta subunit
MIAVVREINRPRYPTVPMRLKSEITDVAIWDNKVMKLPEELVGLKGSPTWVRKIFSPQRAKGEILGDGANMPKEAAQLLIDTLIQKDILAV